MFEGNIRAVLIQREYSSTVAFVFLFFLVHIYFIHLSWQNSFDPRGFCMNDLLESVCSRAHHEPAEHVSDVVQSLVTFSVKEFGRDTGTTPVTSCLIAQVLFLQSKSMQFIVR